MKEILRSLLADLKGNTAEHGSTQSNQVLSRSNYNSHNTTILINSPSHDSNNDPIPPSLSSNATRIRKIGSQKWARGIFQSHQHEELTNKESSSAVTDVTPLAKHESTKNIQETHKVIATRINLINDKINSILPALHSSSDSIKHITASVEYQRSIIITQLQILQEVQNKWSRLPLESVHEVEEKLNEIAPTSKVAFNAYRDVANSVGELMAYNPRTLRQQHRRAIAGSENSKTQRLSQNISEIESQLEDISKSLRIFQGQCDELVVLFKNAQPRDGDLKEVTDWAEAQTFKKVCDSSGHLCRQLQYMCPKHDSHEILFNLTIDNGPDLNLDEKSHKSICNMEFSLSVKHINGISSERLPTVWFRACTRLDQIMTPNTSKPEIPNSTQSISPRPPRTRRASKRRKVTPPALRHHPYGPPPNPGFLSAPGILSAPSLSQSSSWSRSINGSFDRSFSELDTESWGSGICLENLRQKTNEWAADLPRLSDNEKTFKTFLLYSETSRMPLRDNELITLSDWILNKKGYGQPTITPGQIKTDLECVIMAKHIGNAILKLCPSIWLQSHQLKSKNVPLLIKQQTPEPHLIVVLSKSDDNGSTTTSRTRSGSQKRQRGIANRSSNSDILLHLAFILIELGNLDPTPEMQLDNDRFVNREDHEFLRLEKTWRTGLSNKRGDLYIEAIEYCMNVERTQEDIFTSEEYQDRFYTEVILPLEKTERSFKKKADFYVV